MTGARSHSGPQFLQAHVGKLKSRMGGFVPGSHVTVRGVDLHTAFKDAEWMDLYVFAITGRRLAPAQLKMLQTLWTYTSYPDARLWNNRVAALAGSARSTGALGISAALAVSEATIYGRGVDLRAITFLQKTLTTIEAGGRIADCVRQELDLHRNIAGYGRPLTSRDERIEPTLARARELGLDQQRYLLLAQDIDQHLATGRWRMRMNYGAVASAIVADMGLTAHEYYLYGFPAFLAGMLPCHIEASETTEGALFPVACTHVQYSGKPTRTWQCSAGRPLDNNHQDAI